MTDNTSPQPEPAVLFVRVNTLQDLWASDAQIQLLRERFPNQPLYTVVTSQSNTVATVRSDNRFDKVLVVPAEDLVSPVNAAKAFSNLAQANKVAVTVVSVDSINHCDYDRQILSAFLCPGRRFLLTPKARLISFANVCAWPRLTAAILAVASALPRLLINRFFRSVDAKFQSTAYYRVLSADQIHAVRSILWIRLDYIGDFVMSVAALNAVRTASPTARIDVVTQRANIPIIDSVDNIDTVLEYTPPRYRARTSRLTALFDFVRVVFAVRRRCYDLVIDSQGDDYARAIALLSGARIRAGAFPGWMWAHDISAWALSLTHPVELTESDHTTDSCLRFIDKLGLGGETSGISLAIRDEHVRTVNEFLSFSGIAEPFAVVQACSRDAVKTWPINRMTAVVNHLLTKKGLSVLLSGGPADTDYNETIRSGTDEPEKVYNIAGLLPLALLPALLGKARIMFGIDTGPIHVAASIGTPVVALYLKNNTIRCYPYGQRHHIIVSEECNSVEGGAAFDKESILPLNSIPLDAAIAMIDRVLLDKRSPNAVRGTAEAAHAG
jgi:ADP-heptose:LPS heptosyltransferase